MKLVKYEKHVEQPEEISILREAADNRREDYDTPHLYKVGDVIVFSADDEVGIIVELLSSREYTILYFDNDGDLVDGCFDEEDIRGPANDPTTQLVTSPVTSPVRSTDRNVAISEEEEAA